MGKGELSAEELLRLANSASSKDPNALLGAVESGQIHPRRWEHFRNIRSEIAAAKKLNPGW